MQSQRSGDAPEVGDEPSRASIEHQSSVVATSFAPSRAPAQPGLHTNGHSIRTPVSVPIVCLASSLASPVVCESAVSALRRLLNHTYVAASRTTAQNWRSVAYHDPVRREHYPGPRNLTHIVNMPSQPQRPLLRNLTATVSPAIERRHTIAQVCTILQPLPLFSMAGDWRPML